MNCKARQTAGYYVLYFPLELYEEAATGGVLLKQVFLKISQN